MNYHFKTKRQWVTLRLLLVEIMFSFGWTALAARYVPAVPTHDEAEEFNQLHNPFTEESQAFMRRLSPEKKKRWADIHRRFDPELPWRHTDQYSNDWELLLSLGDPITSRYLLNQYKKKYYDEDLLHTFTAWCSPEAVPELMECVMSNVHPLAIYGTRQRGESVVGTEALFANLGNATYLPENVQAWGKGMFHESVIFYEKQKAELEGRKTIPTGVEYLQIGVETTKLLKQIAIDWWAANKEPFMAGRYSEIRPGRNLVSNPDTHPSTDRLSPPILRKNSIPSTHETKAAPQAVATSTEDKPRIWPWFAGIAALLAAVALILKRKTNKPQ